MSCRAYVGVDLGAESGRVIVGLLTEESEPSKARIELVEVHRFVHEPIVLVGGLHWNIPHLWDNILTGLRAAANVAQTRGVEIQSVGVDTWGVDFALIDESGELVSPPRCYRDSRCERGIPIVRERIGAARLYEITGIQEMAINTIVQLAAMTSDADPSLARADRILMLPDYFHMRLGGEVRSELTAASTSQLLDATTGSWSFELLSTLGLPASLFPPLCPPGYVLGHLRADIASSTGMPPTTRVITPGSHDTASAVAGLPARGGSWAYLSSGTWSLLGVEIDRPILTTTARRVGFTNEQGIGGKIRFLKNIVGLWLLQELRRDLEVRGTRMDYTQLTSAAAAAPQLVSQIDPFQADLLVPGGAIEKLQSLALRAGGPVPRTPGELARCCMESLAMVYRYCLDELEALTGRRVDVIHIVGGGSRNALLNQMTANATHRRIVAGPAEATAAGNILVQAMVDNAVSDFSAIRMIVANSFETAEYEPQDSALWTDSYCRFRDLVRPRT